MDVFGQFAAIGFVLALLAAALFLLKKRGALSWRTAAVGSGRRLEVIERVALGPQHALHLVRAGDRLVLIATAPAACQLLDANVSAAAAYGERG